MVHQYLLSEASNEAHPSQEAHDLCENLQDVLEFDYSNLVDVLAHGELELHLELKGVCLAVPWEEGLV